MERQDKIISNIQLVLNALLIFCVIIDPTNQLFHAKLVLFAFFLIFSLCTINLKYVFVPIVYFSIYGISFFIAFITKENIDYSSALNVFKSYLFLIYLLFVSSEKNKTFKFFYFACIAMSILEISFNITWRIADVNLKGILYNFVQSHGSTIMVNTRNFYGHRVISTFYKTSSVSVLTLAISFYLYLLKRNKRFLISSIIFGFCLFCSGTRANLLSLVMIILFIYLLYILLIKKRKLLFIILSTILAVVFIWVVIFLLTTYDYSTNIKQNHMLSYMKLFNENYWKTFLFGYGPGKMFYTSGFNEIVTVSELSYMDIFKNHGLLGGFVLILLLFFPLGFLAKNSYVDLFGKFSIGLGYIAYLCIAGTNPLLVSSTGFMVVSVMFYICDKDLYIEMKVDENTKFENYLNMHPQFCKKLKIFTISFLIVAYLMSLFIISYVSGHGVYYKLENTEYHVSIGEVLEIPVEVTNKTKDNFTSEDDFFISYHLYDENDNLIQNDFNRSTFKNFIKSNDVSNEIVKIDPFLEEGIFIIKLDVVKEGVMWYSWKYSASDSIKIYVK